MRSCVIFNPAAKGEKAGRFLRMLNSIGKQSSLKQTTVPGSARPLATEAVREGFDTIVAAGGDGTLNEVLNGIGDAPDGFKRARLAVLPLGTVNVFAREIQIPVNAAQAWEVIQAGRETRLDLPAVAYQSQGTRVRRYFVQLAGAGLDARAIELVQWRLKKKIGPLAYVVAGLKALCRPPSRITVSSANGLREAELTLVGNGRLYGGPFAIFPLADPRDGLLEVCLFPRANWLTLARCVPMLLARRALPSRAVESFRAEFVTLSATSTTPLQVDGEWIGHLPATFSIEREKLRVVVP